MPRPKINDYIIYKIECKDESVTDVYVGSTANFHKRKNKHKSCCNCVTNKEYNEKKYQIIRANGGWDNWRIVPIDEIKQITLMKSKIIEEYHKQQLDAQMNTRAAFGPRAKRRLI